MRKLALIATLLVSTPALAKAPAPPPDEPAEHPDFAIAAKQGLATMTGRLFDPGSAQFTWASGFAWTYVKPIFGKKRWAWVACGSVNAKNRLGGYVGATPMWIAVDPSGAVTVSDDDMIITPACTSTSPQPELLAATPGAAPIVSTASSPVGVAEELKKLAELRDQGIITPEEFNAQKTKLLAR